MFIRFLHLVRPNNPVNDLLDSQIHALGSHPLPILDQRLSLVDKKFGITFCFFDDFLVARLAFPLSFFARLGDQLRRIFASYIQTLRRRLARGGDLAGDLRFRLPDLIQRR